MKTGIVYMAISALLFASCGGTAKKAGYAGDDLSGKLEITVDPATRATKIRVDVDDPWKLYAGRSVETIDFSKTVATGDGAGEFDIAAVDAGRMYYQFESGENRAIMAERHMPMQGGYNFRDLGGYRTRDGRYVKWGMVLRSDDTHNLTDADLEYLSSIPVVSLVDFRSEQEVEALPDKHPASEKNYYSLRISPGNLTSPDDLAGLDSARTAKFMEEMNILLVSDASAIDAYITFFRALESGHDAPLMFHCSAGKDRTGMAAALFLSALGVPRETIVNDYLLSNTYLGDKYADIIRRYPQLAPMMEVRREYLMAGLDYISNNYSSMTGFLEERLGADIARLKELYLY